MTYLYQVYYLRVAEEISTKWTTLLGGSHCGRSAQFNQHVELGPHPQQTLLFLISLRIFHASSCKEIEPHGHNSDGSGKGCLRGHQICHTLQIATPSTLCNSPDQRPVESS